MQFHLNGFHSGDPRFSDIREAIIPRSRQRLLPKTCDIMIVGCGPAGLNLAAQLSQFNEITTCITDLKDDRLLIGQADGVACRTVEMFQAYEIADLLAQEAYQVNEVGFWSPDPNQPSHIVRSNKIVDVEEDVSEMPHLIINQARVHDHLLEIMKKSPGHLEPYYSRKFLDMFIDNGDSEYPIKLTFKQTTKADDLTEVEETIRCKYLVGCDGARSQVRKSMGSKLLGDTLNQAWGVMDVLMNSDFPDIRVKAVIQSANEGNMLIIPREGGFMVRLYIELDKLRDGERLARKNMSVSALIDAANRILAPYRIDVKEVAWWSVYEIGQRLATAFDDRKPGVNPRVFLAGDACHTHSPKAGQGMNTSLNDTWNLGWKLAHVILGRAKPSLLKTYAQERYAVAQELIDFDREFARMISAQPKSKENPDGIKPYDFQKYFQLFGQFTAGVAVHYKGSEIVKMSQCQSLAAGQIIGKRFHSFLVVRHSDAKEMQIGHCITANGAWRIFAFANNKPPMSIECGIKALCDYLTDDSMSPVKKFTPNHLDIDSVIDFRAVFQVSHREIERPEIHPFLRPKKGRFGLEDFEKVFCAKSAREQNIYDKRGINKESGCIVVVRPDQYVATILALDDFEGLSRFFDGVLRPF